MTDPVQATARQLVSDGRGILAADESPKTMSSRLEAAGVPPTEENRRAYREMLVTTPRLSTGVSGVILCDETFRQQLSDATTFPAALAERGLLPGIKVDAGTAPLAGSPEETLTEGLDGLRARLADYARLGARFAKWRAVIRIGEGLPTWRALRANAQALAHYAALCQEAGLVPIVEPEVLMAGDHGVARCESVTQAALTQVFDELNIAGVALDGIVLKPNMVTAGAQCPQPADVAEVARVTAAVLRLVVPPAVPGIAFLSGGQPPAVATEHLGAIRALGPHPWEVTFSFGRALVDPALAAWRGDPQRVRDGQQALWGRVEANTAVLRAHPTVLASA